MIQQEKLENLYNSGVLFYEMLEILHCSSTTLRKYLKIYNIKSYKGFYSTGKKLGRKPGFKHTEEHKEMMSHKFDGENNPFYGQKHSEDTKQRMSENHADFTGDNNPFRKSVQDPVKLEEHKNRCKDIWNNRDEEYRKSFGRKIGKYYNDIPGIIWQSICNGAKIRDLPITITQEYAYDLIEEQKYICALSGLSITLPKNHKEYRKHEHTASLDRKDSKRGYEPDNIQWTHKVINMMKQTLSDKEFIRFCKEVAKFNE